MKTVLRNLLVLELCLFVPAMWLIFGHMPDRIDICVDTKDPLCISIADQSEGCSIGSAAEPVRFFFADDVNLRDLQIGYVGGETNFSVKSVTLTRNLLVRYDLHTRQLGPMKQEIENATFAGFELPPIPYAYTCFWVSQLLLFLLAIVGACFPQKQVDRHPWRSSVVVGCVLAFFVTVILPLQTILNNQLDFPFSSGEIVRQLSFWLFVYALATSLLIRLSAHFFGRVSYVAVLAVMAYEYLETGVLSISNPSLNGDLAFYYSIGPAIKDAVVMLGVFVLFAIFHKFVMRHTVSISVILFVLMMASLFDVGAVRGKEILAAAPKDESPWRATVAQVVESMHFSSVRNVIVLILDSIQSDASYDAIEHDETLRLDFKGFCAYNNNIGAQSYTALAMPSFFVGRYSPDPRSGESMASSRAAFVRECWGADSFWNDYVKAGYSIGLKTGLLGNYNFSNDQPLRTWKNGENKRVASTSIFSRRTSSMHLCLLDVLRFRVLPFFLKWRALRISLLGSRPGAELERERVVYPIIASHPIDDSRPSLVLVATDGSHVPILYDEDGNRIYRVVDGYDAVRGQTHFVLKCVAGLLRHLRDRGIYDRSMIIVMGDHGSHSNIPTKWYDLKELDSTALPMLWIKPFNCQGAFVATEIPTSHIKLSQLMKAAVKEDLNRGQIERILRTEVRHYRKGRDGDDHYEDLFYDANGHRVNVAR